MNTDNLQSENQNDYARVQFTYVPNNNIPYLDQKLFIIGAITNNVMDQNAEMQFDVKQGVYQKTLLLKQGYYNYTYLFVPEETQIPTQAAVDGSFFQTAQDYYVFVYLYDYDYGYDRLLGMRKITTKGMF